MPHTSRDMVPSNASCGWFCFRKGSFLPALSSLVTTLAVALETQEAITQYCSHRDETTSSAPHTTAHLELRCKQADVAIEVAEGGGTRQVSRGQGNKITSQHALYQASKGQLRTIYILKLRG